MITHTCTCELGEHVLHVGGDALAALHQFVDDVAHADHLLTRRDHSELQVLRVLDLGHLKTRHKFSRSSHKRLSANLPTSFTLMYM